MAKLSFEGVSTKHRGSLKGSPWCLCLGAGVSVGLVPSWHELTRRVLGSVFTRDLKDSDFDRLYSSTGWSFESWLQAALNRIIETGGTPEDFADILERELYSDLLSSAESHGLSEPLRRAFNNPRRLTRDETLRLWDFLVSAYPSASVIPLSRVLVACLSDGTLPVAVLNFNVETIFHTIYFVRHLLDTAEARGKWEFPKETFRRVYRPQAVPDDQIPIYHLHGCILPPARKRRDARDRLVFPESDYSEIARTVFSWAQTTFLHFAQSHRLVFVGHSLADPNARKWLAWTTAARADEAESGHGQGGRPASHVWIERRPEREEHTQILEHSLVHLGTRVCWLDSWDELETALGNLLALEPAPRPGA